MISVHCPDPLLGFIIWIYVYLEINILMSVAFMMAREVIKSTGFMFCS